MREPSASRTDGRVTGHLPGHASGSDGPGVGDEDSGIRLAELVAAFSLATDLGFGQPMEHVLRSWLIAERMAERVGLEHEARPSLYYVITLAMVGCVAETPELAHWFGDDIVFRTTGTTSTSSGCRNEPSRCATWRSGAHRSSACDAAPAWRHREQRDRTDPHHALPHDRTDGASVGPRSRRERSSPTGLRPLGRPRGSVGSRGEAIATLGPAVPPRGRRRGGPPRGRHRWRARARPRAKGNPARPVPRRRVLRRPRRGPRWCRRGFRLVRADRTRARAAAGAVDRCAGHRPRGDRRLHRSAIAVAGGPFPRRRRALGARRSSTRGCQRTRSTNVRRAGLVHDLGMHGIPATILDKAGPLTAAESERHAPARVLHGADARAAAGARAHRVHRRRR